MTRDDDHKGQDSSVASWPNYILLHALRWIFVLVGGVGVILFGWWWGPYFYSAIWISTSTTPKLSLREKIKATLSANLRLRREPMLQVFLAQSMEKHPSPEVRQTYQMSADRLRDHAETMEPGVQRRVWMLQEHERQWGWLKNVDPGAL